MNLIKLRVEQGERVIDGFSRLISWLFVFLVSVIVIQVIFRYVFSKGLIALEELQWHFYAVLMMFGMSYTDLKKSHVGIDLLSQKWSTQTQFKVELLGTLFLFLPFVLILFTHSLPFVWEAWRLNERSLSPSGLPWRWIIKGTIPASILLWIMARFVSLGRSYLNQKEK